MGLTIPCQFFGMMAFALEQYNQPEIQNKRPGSSPVRSGKKNKMEKNEKNFYTRLRFDAYGSYVRC